MILSFEDFVKYNLSSIMENKIHIIAKTNECFRYTIYPDYYNRDYSETRTFSMIKLDMGQIKYLITELDNSDVDVNIICKDAITFLNPGDHSCRARAGAVYSEESFVFFTFKSERGKKFIDRVVAEAMLLEVLE